MIERGQRLGFAPETLEPIVIGREMRGKEFQRDITGENRIAGTIDLSHAARSDVLEHFISADLTSNPARHVFARSSSTLPSALASRKIFSVL
jgi:hypothetical protein